MSRHKQHQQNSDYHGDPFMSPEEEAEIIEKDNNACQAPCKECQEWFPPHELFDGQCWECLKKGDQ